MELKPKEFAEFRDLVYQTSGITLGEGKESLVSSRIGKRMRALGLDDFRSYLDWLRDGSDDDEMVHMLDAISTNVTSFFRESDHFDLVTEVVGKWAREGQARFRFWSAACSSGEEPYTLAMTLCECGLPADVDVRILATDISSRVLASARAGVYPAAKIAELPTGFAQRYFTPARSGAPGSYAAKDRLKAMIVFKRLNLAFPPFEMRGPIDIIFIRNVMIYFDSEVRRRLIAEAHRLLRPGGYLLVGHAESLTGLANDFKAAKPSVYRKREP